MLTPYPAAAQVISGANLRFVYSNSLFRILERGRHVAVLRVRPSNARGDRLTSTHGNHPFSRIC